VLVVCASRLQVESARGTIKGGRARNNCNLNPVENET